MVANTSDVRPIPDARPKAGSGKPLLSVRGVTVRFGGIVALDGVSFDVGEGQIVGLIGPNGAGKTTLFNCLSRLYYPTEGEITFDGASILGMPRHAIAAIGMARTFQNVALFDKLSVLDNVKVGCHSDTKSNFIGSALRLPHVVAEEESIRERAEELVDFMNLRAYVDSQAEGLPFPIRKRVELARALASNPRIILLDEPAAGLNHDEVEVLKEQITRIRDERGTTILLVEHHMSLVMAISDHIVVINFGKRIAAGTPSEVQNDPDVISAYLGQPIEGHAA